MRLDPTARPFGERAEAEARAGVEYPRHYEAESETGEAAAARHKNLNASIDLIEPRALIRDAMAGSLRAQCAADVHAFASVDEWRAAATSLKHNVVLVCVGDATTPHATRLQLEGILDASPGTSVILLGSNDTPAEIVALLEAGARGYISTALQLSVAAEAIALVAEGGVFAPASSLLASIAAHTKRETNGRNSSPGLFTARQEAVLRCLASAKPNKRIAYDLNMCESTVKVHVRTIMKKLRAHNRTEVAVIARDLLASGSAIAKR